MTDTLSGIVWILYIVLGYWSVGQTIYANKIIIGPMGTLWIKRFILGFMFGWVLIPVAIIKCLINCRFEDRMIKYRYDRILK